MALNGKYLEDAERLLEQDDYPQASEKYWGAVASQLNAIAVQRGWGHSTHYHLGDAVSKLAAETGDRELLDLFSAAQSLHANFYQNYMSGTDVRYYAGNVRRLIDKLKALAP